MKATLLTRDDDETAAGFEDLRHHNGRRRVKHVAAACPCIPHDEDKNGIL